MTAAYWEIGRRIVEQELRREARANYGEQLLELLAKDLTKQFGRGVGNINLWRMRAFTVPGPRGRFFRHCGKNPPRTLNTCAPVVGNSLLEVVTKPLLESHKLSASVFFDVVADAPGPNEGHPCLIVLVHRLQDWCRAPGQRSRDHG
jgi:hypothetical protein